MKLRWSANRCGYTSWRQMPNRRHIADTIAYPDRVIAGAKRSVLVAERVLLRDFVDLVGIEPTTSSMPFLIFDYGRGRTAEREWQEATGFHAAESDELITQTLRPNRVIISRRPRLVTPKTLLSRSWRTHFFLSANFRTAAPSAPPR
jgi:hypothetical protein